jgi:serine phosphatase RsbU (regulator of sigma subunit)
MSQSSDVSPEPSGVEVFGPVDLALEAGRVGTWYWDLASDKLRWDRVLERVFDLPPGTSPTSRAAYLAWVHPHDRSAVQAAATGAMASGGTRDMEHRLLLPDGSIRWVSVSSRVVNDEKGTPVAFAGVSVDITDRKLAEERLEFLSRAGQVIGSSLDLQTTFQQVSELAIERLADWCSIDLLDGDTVRLAAIAHRDPAKVSYARRLRERFGVDLSEDQGLPRVLRTGQPEFTPELDEDFIRAALAAIPEFTPAEVEEFVALGLRSALVVPLRTLTGRVLGGLTLVAEEGRRRYTDEDVALALEVAGRAAVAVENAQLYARIEASALTLQRSLLPAALPDVPFAEIAADYHPLNALEVVGGDFYDVFPTVAGRWVAVIGDVAGKGVEAASLTAAARWTLRASLTDDLAPAAALAHLNAHLLRQNWGERYLSVLVCVLEAAPDGLTLRYASGGHPAPLYRRTDSSVEELPTDGQLVGLLPGGVWPEHVVELLSGEALVLYTDGLTDVTARRLAGGDDGHGWYGDTGVAAALSHAPVDATAQRLVEAVVRDVENAGDQRDDRAVLVLRAR